MTFLKSRQRYSRHAETYLRRPVGEQLDDLHQRMRKPDLGAIDRSISCSLKDGKYTCILRVQKYSVHRFLRHIDRSQRDLLYEPHSLARPQNLLTDIKLTDRHNVHHRWPPNRIRTSAVTWSMVTGDILTLR